MKTLGIIPSRYGSSRFPGKPLHLLCGKPLVAWVVEAVKKAKTLDDVIVATDDERIVSAVQVGLESLTGFLGDMVVFLVAALPFIVIVTVVVISVKLIKRRKK